VASHEVLHEALRAFAIRCSNAVIGCIDDKNKQRLIMLCSEELRRSFQPADESSQEILRGQVQATEKQGTTGLDGQFIRDLRQCAPMTVPRLGRIEVTACSIAVEKQQERSIRKVIAEEASRSSLSKSCTGVETQSMATTLGDSFPDADHLSSLDRSFKWFQLWHRREESLRG
jgi:hypothetical protein